MLQGYLADAAKAVGEQLGQVSGQVCTRARLRLRESR